jgi:hypothetical protein
MNNPGPDITLASPLTDLPVETTRARKLLRKLVPHFNTIDDLLYYKDLSKERNCGPMTFADIENTLEQFGWSIQQ